MNKIVAFVLNISKDRMRFGEKSMVNKWKKCTLARWVVKTIPSVSIQEKQRKKYIK